MPRKKGHLGFYFRSISNCIDKYFNNELKTLGLTKSQLDVLAFLSRHQDEPIIQRDIVNYFHISNPTVTGILNRLEQKGYIVRRQSEKDKRIHHIVCTFDAKKLQHLFCTTAQNMENLLTKDFSAEEKEQLRAMLERIRNNVIEEEKEETYDKNPVSSTKGV